MSSSPSEAAFIADMAACTAMLRGGSRTFFAASHFLPRRVNEPATALYAFCRLADDAIDLREGKGAALARLRDRLDRVYEQRPFPLPADRALAHVIERYAIPRTLPDALLEGLAWDAEGRRYEDFSALKGYAVRVAGAVGAMMALLMEARTPQLVARACDLGVAMQLTNIARDVGEDARLGRLYLPLQWLREAGIDPGQWLTRPVFSEPLGIVVKRLLHEADVLYERSRAGISRLPLACQPGIHAARVLYAEIGREVERAGFDSVLRRAVISGRRKAWLLTHVVAALAIPHRNDEMSCLSEAQYLVDAIIAAPKETRHSQRSGTFTILTERIAWLIDLFERLERSERSISVGRGLST